ncbi:hypothetical protein [Campylobacter sp. RM16190]|uniref:hypothetical protein n=1 Tax=Campylobacter sp. RM16190 TaxID=1705727 RepID=UPI001474B687|nr:hypothetical protein [Campylobacter sp. RM16190]
MSLGVKIVLNEEKILREGIYDINEMKEVIERNAIKLGFNKIGELTYMAPDDNQALAKVGLLCHRGLMKCDWFIHNISEWTLIDTKYGDIDLIKKMKMRGEL